MFIETHFIIFYSKFSIFKKKENSKFSKNLKLKKNQNLEFLKKNWKIQNFGIFWNFENIEHFCLQRA